jgi:nucleotide-binding universal stress UspA family protein
MADPCGTRWIHPAVILVATDLTDLDRLMPFALEQAAQCGARLILLHATAISAAMAVDAVGMPYYDRSGALYIAERTLMPWCEAAQSRGIDCHPIVREGDPTQQIAATARQFKADRIILGTRSRGRLGKMLLGSVAEQVLRSVNLPVITVGPEAHLTVQSSEDRIVLLATALRETSRPSAALACELAAQLNAKLVLLHVLPAAHQMIHEGAPSDFEAAAARQLEALAADATASCNPQIETLVLHGNPFIEILAEATARNATLIVLGTTHRSAFTDLMRDRTVYRVIAHARCPVLTLHEAQAVNESGAEYAGASHSSR